MTQDNTANQEIVSVELESEMKRSYLDYAMSVIVSRAIPDVRDGLKPVHRRILYAMQELGYTPDKATRKSSQVVGAVMGKYHPHGDMAIYDALARMAQDFSMRLPLLMGQGNFGSMDGDPPAAARYTEVKLAWSGDSLLSDIDRDTVDFRANYDNSTVEPVVLPAAFPNLLVNGTNGIAVGMATNIPTHNLGEVIDGCVATIDNPDITIDELMQYVHGPDFPTGALILGRGGIVSAFKTGRGSILMRCRHVIENTKTGRDVIVLTDMPYQTNKANLVKRIAECVNEKIIEGISDIRDESNRHGVRVVIELKKDAQTDVVLNQLYKHTPVQTSFGVNCLALHKGRPELMNLKQVLTAFLEFREEVINRRAAFDLRKARDKAHLLIGLMVAVANIDEIIALIRKSPNPAAAREQLLAKPWPAADISPLIERVGEVGHKVVDGKYQLTEEQAKAILDLRLQKLTALERDKINEEVAELVAEIGECLKILQIRPHRLALMRSELLVAKEKFATPRVTGIEEHDGDQDIEDLIPREDMIVTFSQSGYIKRVPMSTYRAQKRGGKGRAAMATKDEDFVTTVFAANTHTPMLFFTNTGRAYALKVYKLPLGNPQSKGKPMINLLPLEQGETISTIMPLPEDETKWAQTFVMFATSEGNVRRNRLSDFLDIRASGKIAMKLEGVEKLIGVSTCGEDCDVLLSTAQGKAIRFSVEDIRVFAGRNSTGVRGIKLSGGDSVISMDILKNVEATAEERDAYVRYANAQRRAEGAEEAATPDEDAPATSNITLSPDRLKQLADAEQFIMTLTAKGFGKRSSAYEFRTSGRGGQGIAAMELTKKHGWVVGSFLVDHDDDIVIVSNGGTIIRTPVSDIRIAGRRTQGVTVFRVEEQEHVVSVARLSDNGDEESPAPQE